MRRMRRGARRRGENPAPYSRKKAEAVRNWIRRIKVGQEVELKAKVFGPVSPNELEGKITEWLEERPSVKIHHAVQSQDGTGWVTLTVFYSSASG